MIDKVGSKMMTKRVYFLVPNEQAAQQITQDLRAVHIDDECIHAVARRDQYPLHKDIPEATVLESSDALPAAKRGALVGGGTGLFAGLVAATVLPLGLIAAGGAVAAMTAAGSVTGAWGASLIGVSVTHSQFKEFEEALDDGQILMLADVDEAQYTAAQQAIKNTHPQVVIHSGTATA